MMESGRARSWDSCRGRKTNPTSWWVNFFLYPPLEILSLTSTLNPAGVGDKDVSFNPFVASEGKSGISGFLLSFIVNGSSRLWIKSLYIPPLFFFLKIFCCCCGPFFKVFIKSATTLLLSYVLVFWPHGILGRWTGIKPAPTVLEGKVLITGPPGSPSFPYLNCPYPSGILAVPTLSSSRNLKACFLISKSKKEKSRPTLILHSCGLLWFVKDRNDLLLLYVLPMPSSENLCWLGNLTQL